MGTPRKLKVLLYIRAHKLCTATDICRALGYSDPRGHISRLRRDGYGISDVWVSDGDTRHKRYFIKESACAPGITAGKGGGI